MEIIRCENSHFYDADKYSSCPYCAEASGIGGNVENLLSTEAFLDNPGNDVGKTVPVNTNSAFVFPSNTQNGTRKTEEYGSTVPVIDYSAPSSAPSNNPVSFTQPAVKSGAVDSYGVTEFANVFEAPTHTPVEPKGTFNPVVGWLVCTEGASRGKDYQIHSQKNYIGRAHHMDICIPTDQCISAEREACLAYDVKSKLFFFSPGNGKNLNYLNDTAILSTVTLSAYDILTIGQTKLMFVPLCGDHFDWSKK